MSPSSTSPHPTGVGVAIKARRKRAGLSQEALASLTDGTVTHAAVSLIERGETTEPRITTLMALARALKCPVSDLIDDHDGFNTVVAAGDVDPQRLQLLAYVEALDDDEVDTALKVLEALATNRPQRSKADTG